ncbi:cuticle protein AM1199 [Penaeus vannamei]|uniref:cuticle protein AM1199 n=1 Tax=Penaeus vannamei TaxID=6689 RepID=UPI000F67E39F|nr:cuticle protein AM1199-like isoform X1 [Penaeus vannamei]XP_027218560.1 cuticle protein AM1199-like isoform X2 [Penaeus vannamei]
MKIALLMTFCFGCAVAAPQFAPATPAPTPVPILMDERDPVDNYGGYGFRFRTGNRISFSESAAPSGPLRKIVTKGSVSFHHPDGTLHHLTYTADENGYRPVSDMIPTPYPLLPWQVEQVRFAERERRLQELADARAALAAQS